ncbi:MAG: guanylate kinase [Clostridia bacterium]|nr:guanylate kinase [Clostridia bacterium]
MAEKGMLIVVSAPSGTGKGAIIERLLADDPNIKHSVSATTRDPRNGETDGVSYFFKEKKDFEKMITNDELLEWDEYCGNYYGTPRQYIRETTERGTDVILDITVAGAISIKKNYSDAVMIFVLPPSIAELEKRITNRGSENENSLKQRLEYAYSEFRHVSEYEYVVVNDNLETAVGEVKTIIHAERMKYRRNPSIMDELYKGEIR